MLFRMPTRGSEASRPGGGGERFLLLPAVRPLSSPLCVGCPLVLSRSLRSRGSPRCRLAIFCHTPQLLKPVGRPSILLLWRVGLSRAESSAPPTSASPGLRGKVLGSLLCPPCLPLALYGTRWSPKTATENHMWCRPFRLSTDRHYDSSRKMVLRSRFVCTYHLTLPFMPMQYIAFMPMQTMDDLNLYWGSVGCETR